MDDLDLRRMFDQIAPTQEQEVTMLDRLHRTEREEQTMKRGMKRGLVALVAAALMMTAAFAVAAGLDQRLMDYFGIGQEDLNLVSNGIVQVDKTHAYKNGWTVEVKQLLFDRYCGEILVDLTAPEGTVLTEQDYRMDFQTLPTNRDLTNQGWGGGIGGEYLPESSDLVHGRISMLLHIHLEVASGDLLAVMGQSGNAAGGYDHCHFEARATAAGKGLDPSQYAGCPNAVGVYGEAPGQADSGEENEENADAAKKLQRISIGPVSRGDADAVYAVCVSRGLVAAGLYKSEWSV